MRFISLVSGKTPCYIGGSDKGRQGFSCIFLLNEERFRTPESSKSGGRNGLHPELRSLLPFQRWLGDHDQTWQVSNKCGQMVFIDASILGYSWCFQKNGALMGMHILCCIFVCIFFFFFKSSHHSGSRL